MKTVYEQWCWLTAGSVSNTEGDTQIQSQLLCMHTQQYIPTHARSQTVVLTTTK